MTDSTVAKPRYEGAPERLDIVQLDLILASLVGGWPVEIATVSGTPSSKPLRHSSRDQRYRPPGSPRADRQRARINRERESGGMVRMIEHPDHTGNSTNPDAPWNQPDADEIEEIEAKDAQPGDWIDLGGDEYARDTHWDFEYAVVVHVEQETDACTRIDFEGYSYGFPSEHIIKRVES